MRKIVVAKSGGDYKTISEAVASVDRDEEAYIFIDRGIYEEKLFIDKKSLIIEGFSPSETVITYSDYAREILDDGKRGTFRSYTAFFTGERITLKNLCIRNAAGDGRTYGQSIAAYMDTEYAYIENVFIDSYQDSLFIPPLPKTEREAGGFKGPGESAPRNPHRQFYKNCRIRGDIDFIFGGGAAVFENCDIISRNRDEAVNGYTAAPCGIEGCEKHNLYERFVQSGFIFDSCRFECEEGTAKRSVYLARPWRDEGAAAFLNCVYGPHIHENLVCGWFEREEISKSTCFIEYKGAEEGGNSGHESGNGLMKKASQSEYFMLLRAADEIRGLAISR